MSTMKLTVINPADYSVNAMARKFVWALYSKTPAEFMLLLEKEALEDEINLKDGYTTHPDSRTNAVVDR